MKDGKQDLLAKFIRISLKQYDESNIDDNTVDEYKQFIKQHIQYEIPLWKQNDVELLITRYYGKKIASGEPVPNKDHVQANGQAPAAESDKKSDFSEKIKKSSKHINDFKELLIDLTNRFPVIKQAVEDFIDS